MTRTFPAVPARLHRLMCTGLFAAAVALGANTIGTAPVAVAAPNGGTWDLDAYEECLKVMRPWESPTQELLDKILKYCCEDSGGIWDGNTCVAPPTEGAPNRQTPSGVGDNPQVAPPPPPPPRDPSRLPQDMPINPGPSAPITTPVPSPS
jgi:hypothetical protein